MQVWVLVMLAYTAPNAAVNWNGPWKSDPGMVVAPINHVFADEASCAATAKHFIADIHHKGILAPFRFRCVPFAASLPVGAPR